MGVGLGKVSESGQCLSRVLQGACLGLVGAGLGVGWAPFRGGDNDLTSVGREGQERIG